MDLVELTDSGLYCAPGDFYVDPWRPVSKALITHAHSDHARWGMESYLAAAPGKHILRTRLGEDANIQLLPYGEPLTINDTKVSFHPAGHVLGSAQIRIEHRGEVWVVSGDYKTVTDPTCATLEPVQCNTFITECTFGLPIYRWQSNEKIFEEINTWWQLNKENGKASVLYCYALGKAQRILSSVDAAIGLIYTHGAVDRLNQAYKMSGVPLPKATYVATLPKGTNYGGSLILAPPSANGTPWLRQFGDSSKAFASGWMRIRGARRRKAVDRGFALSDHADWLGLLSTIEATNAERVIVTHGNSGVMLRWLTAKGLNAESFTTKFVGELDEELETPDAEAPDAEAPNPEAPNLEAPDTPS